MPKISLVTNGQNTQVGFYFLFFLFGFEHQRFTEPISLASSLPFHHISQCKIIQQFINIPVNTLQENLFFRLDYNTS